MAQRPGFPPAKPPPPGASISNAHCNNILQNFRQEDVVYALMTQLREKESELTILTEQSQRAARQQQITEQSNIQLKSKIDLHNRTVAQRDTRMALLEQKLAQEKKGNGSAIAEANLKHLTDMNADSKRILQERDEELSELRPIMKEMKSRIEQYEAMESIQHTEVLLEECTAAKGELAISKDKNITSANTIEQLEKKVKGKEWMIKSLQEEMDDQRSRENHLSAHIKKLNEKIDTYDTKFRGKGVDVPMLLAKLKDYEARTKDLQGQIRRLTNKKLNELVVRSSPVPKHEEEEEPTKKERKATKENKKPDNALEQRGNKDLPKMRDIEADHISEASDTCSLSFLEHDELEDDTLRTIDSNVTDDEMLLDELNPFSTPSGQDDDDALTDFLTDMKVGIEETLHMDSLCCVQRPCSTPLSPVSEYHDLGSPRSPQGGYRLQTFTSESQR